MRYKGADDEYVRSTQVFLGIEPARTTGLELGHSCFASQHDHTVEVAVSVGITRHAIEQGQLHDRRIHRSKLVIFRVVYDSDLTARARVRSIKAIPRPHLSIGPLLVQGRVCAASHLLS